MLQETDDRQVGRSVDRQVEIQIKLGKDKIFKISNNRNTDNIIFYMN